MKTRFSWKWYGIWDSLTVKRYFLDEEMADPIRERGGDEALQLPLRAWDDPADHPEMVPAP